MEWEQCRRNCLPENTIAWCSDRTAGLRQQPVLGTAPTTRKVIDLVDAVQNVDYRKDNKGVLESCVDGVSVDGAGSLSNLLSPGLADDCGRRRRASESRSNSTRNFGKCSTQSVHSNRPTLPDPLGSAVHLAKPGERQVRRIRSRTSPSQRTFVQTRTVHRSGAFSDSP